MPAHRVAGIIRVIEDGDADLFPVDLAGIIAPRRGLSPELLLADETLGVGDVRDALVLLQDGTQANTESAVLTVAERDRGLCRESDVHVEIAQFGVGIE